MDSFALAFDDRVRSYPDEVAAYNELRAKTAIGF
jgi:GrpB-like predicted nucleotidyltransferase (UPF0157 family)